MNLATTHRALAELEQAAEQPSEPAHICCRACQDDGEEGLVALCGHCCNPVDEIPATEAPDVCDRCTAIAIIHTHRRAP